MLNTQQRNPKAKRWCRGDFTSSTVVQFCLLIALWILYALIPYTLPLSSLHFITAAMLLYDIWLWHVGESFRATIIVVAILLNELLALYLNAGFNLFLTLLISAILLFDIANTRS